jgi:hypothetical protein
MNSTRTDAKGVVHKKLKHPVYLDGRTKQSYKDECDINKIMERFAVTNTITHLNKHQGAYADFSDFDFSEQTRQLTRGREIFDDLPAEVRREFGQSPDAFFQYVNDPANAGDLHKKIPGLTKPGNQLTTPVRTNLAPSAPPNPPPEPSPEAPK